MNGSRGILKEGGGRGWLTGFLLTWGVVGTGGVRPTMHEGAAHLAQEPSLKIE